MVPQVWVCVNATLRKMGCKLSGELRLTPFMELSEFFTEKKKTEEIYE